MVGVFQNITGFYHSRVFSLAEYLDLRETNEKLARENTRLKNALERMYRGDEMFFYKKEDTTYQQQYYMTSAKVINNSTNKQNNFLTLNKGSEHGIEPEMGVVSSEGVVGVVYGVSRRFSTVISLLNTSFRVSAKIKKNNYFGSLAWDGKNYHRAVLNEIPFHVEIRKGDTIITSGYSTIFPEGTMIGVIHDFHIKGGNFYEISVNLSTDFKNLTYVNMIRNLTRLEQTQLENSTSND
jgi:rod shape-determining protein MreC